MNVSSDQTLNFLSALAQVIALVLIQFLMSVRMSERNVGLCKNTLVWLIRVPARDQKGCTLTQSFAVISIAILLIVCSANQRLKRAEPFTSLDQEHIVLLTSPMCSVH